MPRPGIEPGLEVPETSVMSFSLPGRKQGGCRKAVYQPGRADKSASQFRLTRRCRPHRFSDALCSDRLGFAQRSDLLPRVTQLQQDFLRMLTVLRHWRDMLGHTFAGTTLKSLLGMESAREVFEQYGIL